MARPKCLTPARQERFLEAIRLGAFPEVAARYAGFAPASYYRFAKGTTPRDAAFVDAFRLAVAAFEVRLTGVIARDAETNPRTAQALLERRFRSRWGPNAAPAPGFGDLDGELGPAESVGSEEPATASPPGYTAMMVPLELVREFAERLATHQRGTDLPAEEVRAGLRTGPDEDNPDGA